MTDFTLRPLTVPERKYTYAQSSQLQGQTGNIGYLRGDFGSSGDQFYTTWFDTRPQWKSDEFKRDLDDVINALRSEEYGLLQSRSQMVRYGRENKESEMQGAYTLSSASEQIPGNMRSCFAVIQRGATITSTASAM